MVRSYWEAVDISIKPDTKRIFAEALESLIETKSFASITIKDIIARSGGSRATFYRHFKDKYDLMNWVFKNQMNAFSWSEFNYSSLEDIYAKAIRIIYDKRRFFSNIVSYDKQNSFIEFLYDYGMRYFDKALKRKLGTNTLPKDLEFSAAYFCHASSAIFINWIKNGYPISPEELLDLFTKNVPLKLSELLK